MPDFAADLSARKALVTGAGAGQGRAIALALAASGASVAVSDINIERAERTCERILERGGAGIALQADISNRFQAANMIETARAALGEISILVNATRIFHPEAMLTIDEWNWRRQLEINITGLFFCMQLMGRVMADEGGGVMINLAAADGPGFTLPAGMAYVASQAAVIAMTRQAARELEPQGIRVNAIVTGSDSQPGFAPASNSESAARVAETALYLCSDAAESLTGQVIGGAGDAAVDR